MTDRELLTKIDRIYGPSGPLQAAAVIGAALGQPRNERAEERLAADLAATDPEPFCEATGPMPTDPTIKDPCPSCGKPCRHEGAERRDNGGLIPAGLVCDWCDWTDREEMTAREVRAEDYARRESARKDGAA